MSELGNTVRLMSLAPAPIGPATSTIATTPMRSWEAARPRMRFVAVKSVAQQDLLALHRVRAAAGEAAHRAQQSDACAAA